MKQDMGEGSASPTVRFLEERREELLRELRAVSPLLVEKLELTLEALKEHGPQRGEYDGLDRAAVIRKYLQKAGGPAGAPAGRFDARSDSAERDSEKGPAWVLALPEWVRET